MGAVSCSSIKTPICKNLPPKLKYRDIYFCFTNSDFEVYTPPCFHAPMGGNHWSIATNSTHLHFQQRIPGLPAATVCTWQCCKSVGICLIQPCVCLWYRLPSCSLQSHRRHTGATGVPFKCHLHSCWYLADTVSVSMKQYVEILTWDGSPKKKSKVLMCFYYQKHTLQEQTSLLRCSLPRKHKVDILICM